MLPLVAMPSGFTFNITASTSNISPSHGGVTAVRNVFAYSIDVSGQVLVFTETDIIERDSDNKIVYQHVTIDGEPGPFGNEINVQVSQINQVFDPVDDDILVQQITAAVDAIKCSKVKGMGTLENYTELLALAQKASDSAQLADPANIAQLEALAAAAESYGQVFKTITDTLDVATEISAVDTLTKIKVALDKISGMYSDLKTLNLTISRAATIKIPDSVTEIATKLDSVYSELTCSLEYLDYFCVGGVEPSGAALNAQDAAAIAAARGALTLFDNLSGSSIANNSSEVAALNTAMGKFDGDFKKRFTDAAKCLDDKFKNLKTTHSTLSGNSP